MEDHMANVIDGRNARRETIPTVIKAAHVRANEILNNPDYAIQAPAFIRNGDKGVYPLDEVKGDMIEVKRLLDLFESKATPYEKVTEMFAQVLEAIVLEQSELGNWLGDGVTTLKTSRFDDIKNGVDMLAEWSSGLGESSHILGLAVDVTFGKFSAEEKLSKIRDEIDRDSLRPIKYFRDAKGSFMGTRFHVPRVIVGIDQEHLTQLASLWNARDNKALAHHPVQKILITEMLTQSRAMLAYAQSKGSEKAAQSYAEIVFVLETLSEEKASIGFGALEQDAVFRSLLSCTRSIFAADKR